MQLNFDPEQKPKLKFSRLGTWYILALSAIAIISIIGQILVQRHLADQFNDSQVVNVAGKQRMLSQKITKAVLLLASQPVDDREIILDQLIDATHLWKLSQDGLQHGNDSLHLSGQNSKTVSLLFEKIRGPFSKMSASAEKIIGTLQRDSITQASSFQQDIQDILGQENLFLAGMDDIVKQYAQEANEKINGLKKMEYLLLFISLFVITAEVLFIFRPTAIQVSRTVNKLRASEKNSRKLLKEIGALYASLERSYEQLSAINEPVENPRLYAKTDRGGNVIFVSDSFLQVTGHTYEDRTFRLSDLFQGMARADDWMDEIVDTVSEGKSWQGDIRFHPSPGAECWLAIIIQPVQIEGEEVEWIVLGSNISSRKLAEQNMNRKNRAEIDKLVNQQKFRSVLILEGQEEERKRIAMDIHDGIGQMLTSLKYQIESIDFKDSHVADKIRDVDHLIKNVIKEVRRVTFNLKPTVLGDYVAGPSHTLPTDGAGKSFAGLTVDQFQRRTSVVEYSRTALKKALPAVRKFAEIEGLDAHGKSAELR